MKLFDYRCECGRVRELPDESPPLCDYCGCQMSRVFTPSYIRVKGGTPNFHGHVKQDVAEEKEREQGISEWESEQKQRREAMRERKKADEQAFKSYCEGELHHKHGRPDEAATFKPGEKYGDL